MASRPAATRHPSQLLTLGIGAIYTLVGLLAFVVTGDFAAKTDKALLGLELNPLHNLVNLLIGLAGLAMWRWLNIAHTYGWLLAGRSGHRAGARRHCASLTAATTEWPERPSEPLGTSSRPPPRKGGIPPSCRWLSAQKGERHG